MSAPFKGLSQSEIDDLLANNRTRNQYGPYLYQFVDSDEAAVNVVDVWPELKVKTISTLYQGFINAAKKADLYYAPNSTGPRESPLPDKPIMVKKANDAVFLLHRERIAINRAAANGNGADEVEPDAEDNE